MEENKYKDVLKGIVEIIQNAEHSDIGFASICSYIGDHCPELENKDEEIRKKLIEYFKGLMGGWFPYSNEEIIAYLEKVKDFDKQLEVQYKRGYDKGYVDGMAAVKQELEKQDEQEQLSHSQVTKKSDKDSRWKWDEDDEKFVRENILIGLGNIDSVSPELYNKIIDWINLIKKRLS